MWLGNSMTLGVRAIIICYSTQTVIWLKPVKEDCEYYMNTVYKQELFALNDLQPQADFCIYIYIWNSWVFWCPLAPELQEPTPGYCLWISALLSTQSSQLCSRTSFPSCTYLTPPGGGNPISCLTGSRTWRRWIISLHRFPSGMCPHPLTLLHVYKQLHFQSVSQAHPPPSIISGVDEFAYRWEVDHLVSCCIQMNLELNAVKTVELIVDFNNYLAPPTSITVCDSPVDVAATAKDKCKLHYIICSVERVIGCNLLSLQDLHASRARRQADCGQPIPPWT